MSRNKRARRSFTPELKAQAVELVRSSGKTVGEVARDLDLTETALRDWVKRALDAPSGQLVDVDERAELKRLREENRVLRMERDFAIQAAPSTRMAALRLVRAVRALRALTTIGVLGALLALGAAGGCRKQETPEAQIRKVLDAGVAALEARDVDAAAALLAEGYKDDAGRTRKRLKQLAFFALQQGPVLVSLQSVDVQVQGEAAMVSLQVLAVQGAGELKSARDLLPTNARAFNLTARLIRDDDAWRITALDGLGGGGGLE